MDELARRFCRQARERDSLRYPPGLRHVAVQYAAAAERGGKSRRQIAEALGLCEATLARWRREPVEAAEIHEVKVTVAEASGLVLVMPSGVRVEGLRLGELVSVLGALG